jgi:hypothetical protein
VLIQASVGGTLGFWCSHTYAYNHEAETPFPATLKGVDAVIWESFQALNLDPKIAPVIVMSDRIRENFSEWYKKPSSSMSQYTMYIRKSLPSEMPSKWIVGHKFGIHVDDGYQADTIGEFNHIYQRWGAYSREHIHWLTEPGQSELQLVYTAVSNIPHFTLRTPN